MFGIGTLLYVSVLLLNAVAILNEERFLQRLVGDESPNFAGVVEETMFTRLIALIRAIRTVMRPFLIGVNTAIVIYEIILG